MRIRMNLVVQKSVFSAVIWKLNHVITGQVSIIEIAKTIKPILTT